MVTHLIRHFPNDGKVNMTIQTVNTAVGRWVPTIVNQRLSNCGLFSQMMCVFVRFMWS